MKFLAAIVLAFAVSGCGPSYTDHGAAGNAVAATLPARQFTMQEFRTYAPLRTKAQIRAEFGPPDFIYERDDGWYYYAGNKRLVVTDPDAGKAVSVEIQFGGIAGPQDPASVVSY